MGVGSCCFVCLHLFGPCSHKFFSLQALHMLTVSAYMEEKAAKYRMEALGRMRVALAGSPPNCFISLMCDYFGYKGEEPVASTTSTAPSGVPASQPATGRSFTPTSLVPVDPSTLVILTQWGRRPLHFQCSRSKRAASHPLPNVCGWCEAVLRS